jgi:hypothetical protein
MSKVERGGKPRLDTPRLGSTRIKIWVRILFILAPSWHILQACWPARTVCVAGHSASLGSWRYAHQSQIRCYSIHSMLLAVLYSTKEAPSLWHSRWDFASHDHTLTSSWYSREIFAMVGFGSRAFNRWLGRFGCDKRNENLGFLPLHHQIDKFWKKSGILVSPVSVSHSISFVLALLCQSTARSSSPWFCRLWSIGVTSSFHCSRGMTIFSHFVVEECLNSSE